MALRGRGEGRREVGVAVQGQEVGFWGRRTILCPAWSAPALGRLLPLDDVHSQRKLGTSAWDLCYFLQRHVHLKLSRNKRHN